MEAGINKRWLLPDGTYGGLFSVTLILRRRGDRYLGALSNYFNRDRAGDNSGTQRL